MDVSTALRAHLADLADSIARDAELLYTPLTTLIDELRVAVPSYRGLQLTIVQTGQPVTLTDLLCVETDGEILTSLRVPLRVLGAAYEDGSRVILYAGTPGALVDLAADVSYVLKTSTRTRDPGRGSDGVDGHDRAGQPVDGAAPAVQHAADGRSRSRLLVLDDDLPPTNQTSGLTGLAELSAVNRAIGLMIGRGHHPDHAYGLLHREAAEAGVDVPVYAARLLGRPGSRR